MSSQLKREVNSLLNYSDEIVFENDYDDEDDRKEKHKNHNSDYSNKKKNKEKSWNNPVDKIIRENSVYDKNQILKALIKQDGLYKMIRDLKEWTNNPKSKKPVYIYHVLRDIVVAAALPEAIDDIYKNEKYDLEKKDFEPLMNELLSVIRNSNDEKLLNKYGKESVEAIREAYVSILYKFNKKKIKKFKEIDLDEGIAKKLVVLTAGKDPNTSIYSLLRYFYKNSDEIKLSEKMLIKIFKICYGKDSIPEVIKCIMNEKLNPINSGSFMKNDSKTESEMWVMIDKLMRDQLESMSKKDLEKTILAYIKDRKIARRQGDTSKRRFGDRRTIHPEDYPKITKVIENLEREDFSIIEYLR